MIAGIAALATTPLIAQGMRGHGMIASEPMTRVDVEARAKARFAEMDANKDGALSKAERKAARETLRAEWKAKKGYQAIGISPRFNGERGSDTGIPLVTGPIFPIAAFAAPDC